MITEVDKKNLREIKAFLESEHIDFSFYIDKILQECILKDGSVKNIELIEPVFVIKNEKYGITEIRYINSISHKIGYQKRWGDDFVGIPQGYFSKLSQSKKKQGIRTIFIKDYEMLEHKDIKDFDGTIIKNYRRKWQVLKSYICTAAGQIHTRIYIDASRSMDYGSGRKAEKALKQ